MLSCPELSALSGFFSTVSLCSWICAQLPQIYTNYKNKSAEGISPSFLLLWFMGDFLSFTSCLFNDVVLKFQIYLSVFFLCNDVVLCYQYYYYNSVYPRKYSPVARAAQSTQENSEDPFVTDRSVHVSGNVHIRGHERSLSEVPTPSSGYSSTSNSPKQGNILAAAAAGFGTAEAAPVIGEKGAETAGVFSKEALGLVLAWGCTFVYCGSRCPQLYKNYKRKSVEGISPLLFGLALLGNLAYTLSIVTSCEFIYDDSKTDFFMRELPYILGSSGTIVFDMLYFYQRHLYRNAGKNTSVMSLEAWNGSERRNSDESSSLVV